MNIQELKDRNLILLECISGSKAYDLDTPLSDTDIKGVFFMPKSDFFGLSYIPQVANESNDIVYYELGRFIDLLVKNNPNILELLSTPESCVLYRHPLMELVRPEMFLSRLCKETFAGYALMQIRKARGFKKKIVNPVAAERKSVLDFCFVMNSSTSIPLTEWLTERNSVQERCGLSNIPHAKGMYALFYDTDGTRRYSGIVSSNIANEVSLSSIPRGESQTCYLFFNKEAYSIYCKEYKEYWDWVAARNEARYQGNMRHGKDYDAKNMMHTIRLLQVALEILRDGRIKVRRQNREELLSIKGGDFAYEDLLQMADRLMEEIELAYQRSPLPDKPDSQAAEALLVRMREQLYDITAEF